MESIYFDRVVRMILGHMRFVLEEGNALVLRDKDGIEKDSKDNIVPEGHSLVLASEDLSYITYGRKGFCYKRYNPESLAIEEEYEIATGGSQFEYENSLPLAAYCPQIKKAFFITISKKTREIWVYEKGVGQKKVKGVLPPWKPIPFFQKSLTTINLKKGASFRSSYLGEGSKKYTLFLSGKDSKGNWQFAIDISKDDSIEPRIVTLDVFGEIVSRGGSEINTLFGKGIDPSTTSTGRGGYVRISTPIDEGDMDQELSYPFRKYKRKYGFMKVELPLVIGFTMLALLIMEIIFRIIAYTKGWSLKPIPPFNLIFAVFLGLMFWAFSITNSKLDRWRGHDIYDHSKRKKTDYNTAVRKLGKFFDFRNQCYQISPSIIAFLLENKILFYNFQTHQILKQRTVQGNFKNENGWRFLKQTVSFSTHYIGSKQIEECEFLVIYTRKDYNLQYRIYDLDSQTLSPITDFSIVSESDVSLKAVLIEGKYQDDAHLPIKLNTRVKIEHTSNPMLLTIDLRDPNDGSIEFYNSLKDSTQVWSNITNISNLIDIVDDIPKGSDITFTLDNKRTRVVYGHGFDVFSQTSDWEKKAESDKKLRHIKGSTEIVPNLETAIFLADGINSPVSTFIRDFSKTFPGLLKDLWTCGLDSKIHQERQNFEIEDDLPALAYMVGELENFKGCNPKQNTALWKDWKEFLSPEQVNRIVQKIKKGVLHSKEGRPWPRKGFAHRMMHGDLTPTNVIVNSGNVVEVKEYYQPVSELIESIENYNLLLCDFSDLVVLNEKDELIYRTEIVKNSEQTRTRVSSQFFDTTRVPKINPMLDLAKFLAHLWLKIPFEPSKRDMLNEEKYLLRNDARIIREKRDEALFHEELANELNKALDWAEKELKISCKLDEPGRTKESWRELLKAMIFDQCLQIIMFWKGYRSKAAWEITPTDLCWIFYLDDGGRPLIDSPTFLEKADYIMRKGSSGDGMVYLSAAENKSRNNTRVVADHVDPKLFDLEQTKIHHPSGSFYEWAFYEWAKNQLDVYNESHFLEHDVVETTDDENQLNSPFYRVVLTQTAKDSLNKYTEKIYDPLEKWVSNKDLIEQSSMLYFEARGQIQLYKSKIGQSSRVLFAIYDYGDDVILHVIGFYVYDD